MDNYLIIPNTILENIVGDLRPTLKKYYGSIPIFGIGIHDKKYEGYQLIQKSELESIRFMISLDMYYQKNKGILLLDDLGEEHIYVRGDNIDLYTDDYRLRVQPGPDSKSNKIDKGSIIKLYDHDGIIDDKIFTLSTCSDTTNVGLFVLIAHK